MYNGTFVCAVIFVLNVAIVLNVMINVIVFFSLRNAIITDMYNDIHCTMVV